VNAASVARHTATGRRMIELHTQANTPMFGSHSHSTGNASGNINNSDIIINPTIYNLQLA